MYLGGQKIQENEKGKSKVESYWNYQNNLPHFFIFLHFMTYKGAFLRIKSSFLILPSNFEFWVAIFIPLNVRETILAL